MVDTNTWCFMKRKHIVLDNFKDIPPQVHGMMLAVIVAIIRVIYDREETSCTRMFLEAILCGLLTLTAGTAVQAMGLNQNWVLVCGGVIGFMGSQAIRAFASKYINKRVDDA